MPPSAERPVGQPDVASATGVGRESKSEPQAGVDVGEHFFEGVQPGTGTSDAQQFQLVIRSEGSHRGEMKRRKERIVGDLGVLVLVRRCVADLDGQRQRAANLAVDLVDPLGRHVNVVIGPIGDYGPRIWVVDQPLIDSNATNSGRHDGSTAVFKFVVLQNPGDRGHERPLVTATDLAAAGNQGNPELLATRKAFVNHPAISRLEHVQGQQRARE